MYQNVAFFNNVCSDEIVYDFMCSVRECTYSLRFRKQREQNKEI